MIQTIDNAGIVTIQQKLPTVERLNGCDCITSSIVRSCFPNARAMHLQYEHVISCSFLMFFFFKFFFSTSREQNKKVKPFSRSAAFTFLKNGYL